MVERLYRDKEWLEQKYGVENLTYEEIGEMCDVDYSTIAKWTKKHVIVKRFKDEAWLRKMYVNKDLSIEKMATIAHCSDGSIRKHLRKYDIGSFTDVWKPPIEKEWLYQKYNVENKTQQEIVEMCKHGIVTVNKSINYYDISTTETPYFFDDKGYSVVSSRGEEVRIPRLVAVAEYGFDAVRDCIVHHKNTHKFDNRPNNLELLDNKEHSHIHTNATGFDDDGNMLYDDVAVDEAL